MDKNCCVFTFYVVNTRSQIIGRCRNMWTTLRSSQSASPLLALHVRRALAVVRHFSNEQLVSVDNWRPFAGFTVSLWEIDFTGCFPIQSCLITVANKDCLRPLWDLGWDPRGFDSKRMIRVFLLAALMTLFEINRNSNLICKLCPSKYKNVIEIKCLKIDTPFVDSQRSFC